MSELHEKLNIRPIPREKLDRIDDYDGPLNVVYTDLGKPAKSKIKEGVLLRSDNGYIWMWVPVTRFAELYRFGEEIMKQRNDLYDGVFLLCARPPEWMNVTSYTGNLKHGSAGYTINAMWSTNIILSMIRDEDAFVRLCEKNDFFRTLRP